MISERRNAYFEVQSHCGKRIVLARDIGLTVVCRSLLIIIDNRYISTSAVQ